MEDGMMMYKKYLLNLYNAHDAMLRKGLVEGVPVPVTLTEDELDIMKVAWLWFLSRNLLIAQAMEETMSGIEDVDTYTVPDSIVEIMRGGVGTTAFDAKNN